ncbi:MAG: PhnP protein [Bacteroidetes bacterium]|nr:MAG: PhnP protein [Bacteroidota bacterium]
MKITVLGSGTSQGVPVIACPCDVCASSDPFDKRLRSSVLIETATTTVVIDAGPDFRQQMLRAGVKKLDAILITHTHKDHIAGLDDVRSFNYLTGKAVVVYARPSDQLEIKQEFSYAFSENPYPGVPEFDLRNLSIDQIQIGDLTIQPVELKHMNLSVFGFRIGDFSYLTDVNFIPKDSMDILKGTQILIIDALRKKAHPSHFNLDQAIDVAQHLEVPQTYFTHISHLMGKHSAIEKELPKNINLAWDGLEIEL